MQYVLISYHFVLLLTRLESAISFILEGIGKLSEGSGEKIRILCK